MTSGKRLIILSGPSCAGKGPLQKAVNKLYADERLLDARPVLCHSRGPRQGEVHGKHYYFLPPALIKSLEENSDFAVAPVRSDWQAIDLLQVKELLETKGLVFAEVYCTFGTVLKKVAAAGQTSVTSIFLLPASMDTEPPVVMATMYGKLEARGTEEPKKWEERARAAHTEMQEAIHYTHRILNPIATEDSIGEWGEFGTRSSSRGRLINRLDDLGDNARWLVETFVCIMKGELGAGEYKRNF